MSKLIKLVLATHLLFAFPGCAGGFLKTKVSDSELSQNTEFTTEVQIDTAPTLPEVPVPPAEPLVSQPKEQPKPPPKKAKRATKRARDKSLPKPAPIEPQPALVRQPELEGINEGYQGRRPLVDPFKPGEEITHEVSYFNVKAGELHFRTKPFAQVNKRKAYAFELAIETSSLFSSFYSVKDSVDVFLDFFELVPLAFALHVKETGQVKEARSWADWPNLKFKYWERKVTEKDGVKEERFEFDVLPYSQDIFSSIFYLRIFPWAVGKEFAFRVADDKENMIFRGKAVAKETLETKAGTFPAIKIKPEVTLKGKFKPVGDIYIWLADNPQKHILRIESKIKIGTLVSEVTKIK